MYLATTPMWPGMGLVGRLNAMASKRQAEDGIDESVEQDVLRTDHRPDDRRDSGRMPIARFTVAASVIGIWAGTTMAAVFGADIHVPPGFSAVCIAAATYLFGADLLKKIGKD
jgi:hypothetical protein